MAGVDRIDWKGRWIWYEGPERPRNFYLRLRKVCTLHGDVASAQAFCVGDSQYMLFVNGIFVGRGPARSDPRWQSYDRYNLKPYLRRGQNVMAAVVHHIGEETFSYMPGRGGFLFQMDGETRRGKTFEVVSDRSWRVKPGWAWDDRSPRIHTALGFTENYDARRADPGWMEPEFDDSEWAPATVIGKAGMKPWSWLMPRDIPLLREEVIYPRAVLDRGQCVRRFGPFHINFKSLIIPHQDVVGYAGTYVWTPRSGEVELSIGSTGGVRVWIGGIQVVDRHVHGPSEPGQERVRVHLERGWTPILVKVDQGMGDWDLHFALEGLDDLIYSVDQRTDKVAPGWMVVGPFDNEMVGDECVGFQLPYPPEREMDFKARYEGKGGRTVQWIVWDSVAQQMAWEDHVPLQNARIEHPTAMLNDRPEAMTIELSDPAEAVYVTVDLGREATGYPRMDLEVPPGTVVDLGYSEVLENGRVAPFRNGVKYADRYVAGDGKACWEVFGQRGFRYMQATFRGATGPVHVYSMGLTFSTYPVEYRGTFRCSDERLNRIWEVGRYTVHLCMHDTYEDGPWCDQAPWWGDARIEALVNYYTFGDRQLMARGLRQIARSQREDGLTAGMYPDGQRAQWVPTFSLLWVISLWEYFTYTGDEELVRELYPNVQRLLKWFEGYVGHRGILEDVPDRMFVDWCDIDHGGEIAALNCFYVRALEVAAQMAQVMDDEPSRAHYPAQSSAVRTAMNLHLWSEKKGVYTDGPGSERVSQHVNLLAVLFNLVEERHREDLLRYIFSDSAKVVQIGSPYFMFYALDALFHSGQVDHALQLIRDRWGAMLDAGATTCWERFDPEHSWCHGGSAGPTYFLSAELLGVKPVDPGFSKIQIRPGVGDLAWAEGVVPTVRGDVCVSWKQTEGRFQMQVDIPKGCVAMVGLPKLSRPHPRIELRERVVWEGDRTIPHEHIRTAWEDTTFVWFEMRRAGRHVFVSRET